MMNNLKTKDIKNACDKQTASILIKIFFLTIIIYVSEFFIMGRLDNFLKPSTEFTPIVGYEREIIWFGIISSLSIVVVSNLLKKVLIEVLIDDRSP